MAWRRQRPEPEPVRPPQTPSAPAPTVSKTAPPARTEQRMEDSVNIGKSIQIKGELRGNEDLTIEGQVDGKIVLKDHQLTIGPNGRLTAEIHAKSVTVVGEVVGNVTADDRIEIAATGSMQGDIKAPRVVLADGARFKGSVDMERATSKAPAQKPAGASQGGSASASNMPRSAAAKG